MAKTNDRDLAIARVYGESMLDLAEERGEADALLDELAELAEALDRDPEFERFLGSPLVDAKVREQVIEKLFRGRASDLLVDALQVINRKGRLAQLAAVAQVYRAAYRERRGLIEVEVKSAVPLTDAQRGRLAEVIARRTGKRPALAESVDPRLLGGLVVRLAGEKIDASVAARLRDLAAALARRGVHEMLRGGAFVGE
jgi:F-type H+-transporting ATPase subunit delta